MNDATAHGAPAAPHQSVEPGSGPIWCRMPGPGERLEGLSRADLYALWGQGRIRTKAIVKPGNQRGIRLVDRRSVVAYIESLPETAARPS